MSFGRDIANGIAAQALFGIVVAAIVLFAVIEGVIYLAQHISIGWRP